MIKKGDKVIVIAGKEKGKTAVVKEVLRKEDKVILEGLNIVKRHTRPQKAGEKGGIAEKAMPIHISNVKLADKAKKGEKKEEKKPAAKKKSAKKVVKAEE